MARHGTRHIIISLLAVISMLAAGQGKARAAADGNRTAYTKERPLIVVSDWDFAPYEYSNDKGEPEGYNVEIIREILNRLGIPHVFLMREWSQAIETFNEGKADLIVYPVGDMPHTNAKRYYSRKMLAPYKIKAAYKRGTPPLKELSQLGNGDLLALKKYDYSTIHVMKRSDINKKQLRINSPKTCLTEISNRRYRYFIWGEAPMKEMLKNLGYNDIDMCDIDIPSGDMRFVSHDRDLIHDIDDQFARLDQSGVVSKIFNKWFHPEKPDNDVSPVVFIIIIVLIIIVGAFIVTNHFIALRIKHGTRHTFERTKIMTEALNMNGNYVVRLDFEEESVKNIYGMHLPPEGMTAEQYYQRIHPEDQKAMFMYTEDILNGKPGTEKGQTYRWNAGTAEAPKWILLHNQSIIEKDRKSKRQHIISTLTDITEVHEKEQHDKELAAKFSSIFDSSIVGMSLYDRHGTLINTNRQMRRILKFRSEYDEFYYKQNLTVLLASTVCTNMADIDDRTFCSRCYIPERSVSEYIEIRVRPINNSDGELLYVLITVRTITKERQLYLQQKENNRNIRRVNEEITKYENNLRYLLEESKTRIWRSSLASRRISFYKNLRIKEKEMTIDDFIGKACGDDAQEALRTFIDPQADDITPLTVVIQVTDFPTAGTKKKWFSINRIPEYDDNGTPVGCFGLMRDMTELMEAQEKLKEETMRANDSEKQKSVFLANMSHEIRTPLNAIVGFCDLLPAIDDSSERGELIRIIRKNCDLLMHLVDDILIISTMDADGPKINPKRVDFAKAFDDLCTTLEQQTADTGVEFIKDNPYRLFVTELDIERTQQIIINFTTNAVKFTTQGHIKVGYRIENNGIYIYCEDTGKDIPKEKCADVFRRFVKLNDFVQGTGLGLNICKAIADSCGGRIGVESEPGKGSTFWVWLPCPNFNVEP